MHCITIYCSSELILSLNAYCDGEEDEDDAVCKVCILRLVWSTQSTESTKSSPHSAPGFADNTQINATGFADNTQINRCAGGEGVFKRGILLVRRQWLVEI